MPEMPQPLKTEHRVLRLVVAGLLVIAAAGVGAAAAVSSGARTDNSGNAAPAASAPCDPATALCPVGLSSNDPDEFDALPNDGWTTVDTSIAMGTPIGSVISVSGGGGMEAEITVDSVSSYNRPADGRGQPPANGRFAVVEVTIKVISGVYDYGDFSFGWREAKGAVYESGNGNAGPAHYGPGIGSGKLHSGQTKRGNVIFDVPRTPGSQVTVSRRGSLLGSWK
jgi:hypothetical protein